MEESYFSRRNQITQVYVGVGSTRPLDMSWKLVCSTTLDKCSSEFGLRKQSFAKPVGYISGIPTLPRNYKTSKFKGQSTGSGTKREKDIFERTISKEISCE
jgi:hypothetical protein